MEAKKAGKLNRAFGNTIGLVGKIPEFRAQQRINPSNLQLRLLREYSTGAEDLRRSPITHWSCDDLSLLREYPTGAEGLRRSPITHWSCGDLLTRLPARSTSKSHGKTASHNYLNLLDSVCQPKSAGIPENNCQNVSLSLSDAGLYM